jgi:hypothetical protein
LLFPLRVNVKWAVPNSICWAGRWCFLQSSRSHDLNIGLSFAGPIDQSRLYVRFSQSGVSRRTGLCGTAHPSLPSTPLPIGWALGQSLHYFGVGCWTGLPYNSIVFHSSACSGVVYIYTSVSTCCCAWSRASEICKMVGLCEIIF